jgi:hypothetical protein
MPRKSRRAKAKHRERVANAAQEGRLSQAKPMPAGLPSSIQISSEAQNLPSRYQYVMPEIKRIGIIAGAIIVVLIILSFVLG